MQYIFFLNSAIPNTSSIQFAKCNMYIPRSQSMRAQTLNTQQLRVAYEKFLWGFVYIRVKIRQLVTCSCAVVVVVVVDLNFCVAAENNFQISKKIKRLCRVLVELADFSKLHHYHDPKCHHLSITSKKRSCNLKSHGGACREFVYQKTWVGLALINLWINSRRK